MKLTNSTKFYSLINWNFPLIAPKTDLLFEKKNTGSLTTRALKSLPNCGFLRPRITLFLFLLKSKFQGQTAETENEL